MAGTLTVLNVSIHALLAECDAVSTYENALDEVSIHALLAECDANRAAERVGFLGFNPRTPCGVRPMSLIFELDKTGFQSTHSLRSATGK